MKFASRAGLHVFDFGRSVRLALRPNWPRPRGTIRADVETEGSELSRLGTTVLEGIIPGPVCDQVIRDYENYEARLTAARIRVRNEHNRNYRLTNFHLVSQHAMSIACNPFIHGALDAYFGKRSMVYTSLYYKHGSQQKTHLDTPFFVTNPIGWFAGVWVALEDVSADAGPVEYFRGAHRLFDTSQKLRSIRVAQEGLDSFFDRVRQRALEVQFPAAALLKKGDVLIWHHGMPHSGVLAANPVMTRHSMVFHMGAEGVNIRLHGVFDSPPRVELPRYGWFQQAGRRVARVGLPAFMY